MTITAMVIFFVMNTCCFSKFAELQNIDFKIMTSIPGIPTAGDNFTITCIVTGPERLAITPQLDWEVQINEMSPIPVADAEDDIGIVTTGNTVPTEIANFSRTLSFTRIRTSQARRYLCQVFISGVISQSAFADLHVQSMSQLLCLKVPHITFCVLFFMCIV